MSRAYLAGWSITLGAIAAGLLMAVLASHPRLREDSIIGTVSVVLFATALIIISSQDSIGVDLGHFLLGSLTTVTGSTCATERKRRDALEAPIGHGSPDGVRPPLRRPASVMWS